jgi:hypothetical protein
MTADGTGGRGSNQYGKKPKPPVPLAAMTPGHIATPDPLQDEPTPPSAGARLAAALPSIVQVRTDPGRAGRNRAQSDEHLAAANDSLAAGRHAAAAVAAYDAARLAIEAAMAHLGVRVGPDARDKHVAQIDVAGHLLGPSGSRAIGSLQVLKQVRNRSHYDAEPPEDARESVATAATIRARLAAAVRSQTSAGWPEDWPAAE